MKLILDQIVQIGPLMTTFRCEKLSKRDVKRIFSDLSGILKELDPAINQETPTHFYHKPDFGMFLPYYAASKHLLIIDGGDTLRYHTLEYEKEPAPFDPDLEGQIARNPYGKYLKRLNLTISSDRPTYAPEEMFERLKRHTYIESAWDRDFFSANRTIERAEIGLAMLEKEGKIIQ